MTTSGISVQQRVRQSVFELEGYAAVAPRPGVRLDANESPFPPSEDYLRDLANELSRYGLNRYPDPTAERVRKGLASRLGGTAEQYLVGNGSDECLLLLPALFEHSAIAYLDPSFAMYRIAALTHRHAALPITLRPDFSLDEPKTSEILRQEQPAIFYIASPNNPTNNTFDPATLTRLIQGAPGTLFVIDEAYGPYNEWAAHRIYSAAPNVAVLGTISKIGFAGLRLGWIRLHPELASQLDKLRAPYNTSVPAQLGAALLLEKYWKEAHRNVDTLIAERSRIEAHLSAVGYRYTASHSNSLLVDCGEQSDVVRAKLQEQSVFVRWFSHPSLLQHFRVSIGTPSENDAFMKALPHLNAC